MLRTDAVWEKYTLASFFNQFIKCGIFFPAEQKYIIKDAEQDPQFEKTDEGPFDLSEHVDFNGLTKDGKTTEFQICIIYI